MREVAASYERLANRSNNCPGGRQCVGHIGQSERTYTTLRPGRRSPSFGVLSGKSPAMLAASRTAAQCRPREGPAVAFGEVGESLFAAFFFGRMHPRSAFANA